jgi:endogenous inhibitor of DNA gyrase (YacG/DUF329 family)
MAETGAQESAFRLVTCPQCGGDSVFAPSNRYRPFCSERCKNIDLGAWASEAFKLPNDASDDDPGSEHS